MTNVNNVATVYNCTYYADVFQAFIRHDLCSLDVWQKHVQYSSDDFHFCNYFIPICIYRIEELPSCNFHLDIEVHCIYMSELVNGITSN